jgi:type IV secretory pathway VirB10-like protein
VAISKVVCPECKAGLTSKTGFQPGAVVSCPKCGTYFEVSADVAPPVEKAAPILPAQPLAAKPTPAKPAPAPRPRDEDDEDDRPRKKKPVVEVVDDDDDEDDRPRKKRRRDDEDEEDDRPRNRKKKRKSGGGEDGYSNSAIRYVVLGVLVLVMLVLGVMLIIKKMNERDQDSRLPRAVDPLRVRV